MATRAQDSTLEPYEGDFSVWLAEQAALVRAGRWAEVDRKNVAEELESLGKSQFTAYVAQLRLNLSHRLKWDFQPVRRTNSWKATINRTIGDSMGILHDNPSFRSRQDEAFARAWRDARQEASRETDMPLRDFPEDCPYSWATMMSAMRDEE